MIEFEQEVVAHNSLARIKVLGIGGAGGNTINHMINAQYENVEFLVANTDAQAIKVSQAPLKIQLGARATRGLGAGANPEMGKKAAEEDLDKILEFLHGADIVFLVAGLGGGTGSGALPVIAHAVREAGESLCIAVVTKPFSFEGKRRMGVAEKALEAVRKEVDTLIVIPNQKLIDIADHKVALIEAFDMINGVIHQFVKGIADIICRPGHINVDFADVCTIMKNMGTAVMGTGRASGADRAKRAALQAISSPLLENIDIHGARAVLINITGSSKLGLYEVNDAASLVYDQAHPDANIIMGSVIDDSMGDEVMVTIIATGVGELTEEKVVQATPVVEVPAVSLEAEAVVEEVVETAAVMLPAQSPQDDPQVIVGADEPEPVADVDLANLDVPTFMRRAKEKELSRK